jgi:hypothetical protein
VTDPTDDSADETVPGRDDDTPGGLSKRTLIRLLVGFGIGIPILVEAITFLGLLDQQLGGGDTSDGGTGGTATETATPGVTVGDDLLPETNRSETLASAVLREADADRWPLSLTVEVRNSGDADYEFQLLGIHLADGRTVGGRTSTDRLTPGERRTITGEWPIPAGSTPRAVEVVALVYPDGDGSVETIQRRVELAKIPVRGG